MNPEVEAVLRAWVEEGSHPEHHRSQQYELRRTWPTLATALDQLELAAVEKGLLS